MWKSTTLAVNYVGTHGQDLLRSRYINAPVPPTFSGRPDPTLGGRTLARQFVRNYFSRKCEEYVSGTAQYRLAFNRDDTIGIGYFPPNSYDLSGEWGPSDFDRRHRFEMLGTVKPGKLLDLGVSVSLYSGLPYTLTTGLDSFNTGTSNARRNGFSRNSLRDPGYADVGLRWSRDFSIIKGKKKDSRLNGKLAVDAFDVLNRVNYVGLVGN